MWINVGNELDRSGRIFSEIEGMISWPDERLFRLNTHISGWSAADHLYHVAVTNRLVFGSIQRLILGKGSMEKKDGKLTRAGLFVLGLRRFPKGLGKAPGFVQPPSDLERATLEKAWERSTDLYANLHNRKEDITAAPGRIKHPVLGMLDARQWLLFVRLHTRHHLNIISILDRKGFQSDTPHLA